MEEGYWNGYELGGDIFTVEEFDECCRNGLFIDYDGYGEPISMRPFHKYYISPSWYLANREKVVSNYRYIVWYNR